MLVEILFWVFASILIVSALAMIMFVIVMALTIVQLELRRRDM